MRNYKKKSNYLFDLKLIKTDYYDITLSSKNTFQCNDSSESKLNNCLIADFNFTDSNTFVNRLDEIVNNINPLLHNIKTNVKWSNSTKGTDFDFSYFGFNAYDSGVLTYKPIILDESITTKNFNTEIFSNTHITNIVNSNHNYNLIVDDTLTLYPISGNLDNYTFDMFHSIDDDLSNNTQEDVYVLDLKGGFYQGFYKIQDTKYETLPNRNNYGFSFSTWIKPMDYDIDGTINEKNPNNQGFFFYLGTKSENKFWSVFEALDVEECSNKKSTTYYTNIYENEFKFYDYLTDEELYELCLINKEDKKIKIEDHCRDITPDLYKPLIQERTITNKFLLAGRGCKKGTRTGLGIYTVHDFNCNPDFEAKVPLLNVHEYNKNPFLLFSRNSSTKNYCGYEVEKKITVHDINKKYDKKHRDKPCDINEVKYNYLEDVYDNVLGFRITCDGRIGYKTVMKEDDKYLVVEEYSDECVVSYEQWNHITLSWIPDKPLKNPICDPLRNGDLKVYVDGYLVHVFYDFKEFVPRELNDNSSNVIGLSHNISIGGGSLGLMEHFTLMGQDKNDLNLIIEDNFAGSFMGKISEFKLYDCYLSVIDVKKDYNNNKDKYKTSQTGFTF